MNSLNNNNLISDMTVLEQFDGCGFTDGEDNFYFERSTNFYLFQIQLHIDDFHTLVYRDVLVKYSSIKIRAYLE